MFSSTLYCTVPWAFHPWILPCSFCLEHMLVSITSSCQYKILWYLHLFPVSCLGIPVSGLPHIFLVRTFSTFLWKTLLFHLFICRIVSHLQLIIWVSKFLQHSKLSLGFHYIWELSQQNSCYNNNKCYLISIIFSLPITYIWFCFSWMIESTGYSSQGGLNPLVLFLRVGCFLFMINYDDISGLLSHL